MRKKIATLSCIPLQAADSKLAH